MKRKILYMLFLLMIFVNSFTYAQDTDVMEGQKKVLE